MEPSTTPSHIRPHNHSKSNHPKHNNPCIVIYTTTIILSCFYLQTQIFQPILNDRTSYYASLFTYFDVLMCLWSYFQTIKTKCKVEKLRGIPLVQYEQQKISDFAYGITDKNCQGCNYYKFPRVSHCSTCGQCIYKMDHHCVWTQTCIGFSNQKSFYLFCFYMALGVLQFWYFTIRVFKQVEQPFFEIMEPGVVILWAFTGLSAFLVGIMILMLLLSHTVMIFTNHRTLDSMKSGKMCPLPFISTDTNPNLINLFDRGEIQNMKSIFGDVLALCFVPLPRYIQNQFFPQKMSPYPSKIELMTQTNLFDVQKKYTKYMKQLSQMVASIFIGKKMRINNQIFIVAPRA